MADDIHLEEPPAYSYSSGCSEFQHDEVNIDIDLSSQQHQQQNQQNRLSPAVTGFKLDDKPPPYPGPPEIAASNQYVLNSTGFQSPPMYAPSYQGFPDQHRLAPIITHTPCTQQPHVQRGTVLVAAEHQYEPPTQMGFSCMVLWLCFPPIGLIAFIYSTMVKRRYNDGDYQGAVSASHCARVCANMGFFLGLCIWTLLLAMFISA